MLMDCLSFYEHHHISCLSISGSFFSISKGRCICGQLDHLLHSCPQRFPFLHKAKFASISYPHPKQYSFYKMKIQENLLDHKKETCFPDGPKSCCVPVNFRNGIPKFFSFLADQALPLKCFNLFSFSHVSLFYF